MKQTITIYVLAVIVAVLGTLLLVLSVCEEAIIAWREKQRQRPVGRHRFAGPKLGDAAEKAGAGLLAGGS